jgi:hypothetical protein
MVVTVLSGRIRPALVMMIVTSHRRVIVVMIFRFLIVVIVLMVLSGDRQRNHCSERKRGQGEDDRLPGGMTHGTDLVLQVGTRSFGLRIATRHSRRHRLAVSGGLRAAKLLS